jgi:hypothetical protein
VAGVTALIGYWMRRGLPEPKTFLKAKAEDEAAEAEEKAEGGARGAAVVVAAKADVGNGAVVHAAKAREGGGAVGFP